MRPVSSTRVSTETYAARSTSTKEKRLTSPRSRRSFVKRSPSTGLASRNLRRKRSPKRFRPSSRESLEVVGDLWSAFALVRQFTHELSERFQVAGDPQRAHVDRIETDVADQRGRDTFRVFVVSVVDHAWSVRSALRFKHAEEGLAWDRAERRDHPRIANLLRELLRFRRCVGGDKFSVLGVHRQ